jgi:hypothetical protein
LLEAASEGIAAGAGHGIGEPKPDNGGLSRPNVEFVVRGCLGPRLLRIDRILPASHDMIADAILNVGRGIARSKQPLVVGLVLRE